MGYSDKIWDVFCFVLTAFHEISARNIDGGYFENRSYWEFCH